MREKKTEKKKGRQTHHENRAVICTSSISRRISLIIFVVVAGFIIAMMNYHGTFLFWKYPVCDLGTLYTVNHQKFNLISLLFFDLAMLFSGFLMIQIGSRFTSDIPFQHKKLKQILSFTCGFGFFLVMFPYPLHLIIHITGATLAVGSLWILAIVFSVEIKPFISSTSFFFCQLFLHGSIVTYGILYMMRLFPANEVAQKVGLISLMIILWLTTRYQTRDSLSRDNS